MTKPVRGLIRRLAGQDSVSFWLTNRIPRRTATLVVGRLSKIEQPMVRDLCMRAWRLFADIDLTDAETTAFRSMHDCFTRRLRAGARRPDPDPAVLASPSDGIVGEVGRIRQGMVLQAKDSAYAVVDLLAGDTALAAALENGRYATLRLTSGMYHRFHAPGSCRVRHVTYVSGDAWNVNPATLARIPRLFCRNERAIIRCELEPGGETLVLVPVAAILVASIRLQFLDVTLHLRYRGPHELACDAALQKGDELGWFEHGSTIVVLAPAGFTLAPGIRSGAIVRAGQALLARDPVPPAGPAVPSPDSPGQRSKLLG